MITFVVDVLLIKNYYGPGGMMLTEYWVFVMNAFFPPLVWVIDISLIILNIKIISLIY